MYRRNADSLPGSQFYKSEPVVSKQVLLATRGSFTIDVFLILLM